jgi:hypothetical protein
LTTAETVKMDTPDSRATSEMLAALPGSFGLVFLSTFLEEGMGMNGNEHIRLPASVQNV